MLPLLRTLFGLIVGGVYSLIASVATRSHGNETIEGRKIARRGFVRNAALGAVVIVLTQIGAGFVRFFWPNKTGDFGQPITVGGADIPEVDAAPFAVTSGKFYLVNTQSGLMALYWTCPHLGCTVPWVDGQNQFQCPCHGSIYEYNGVRIAGPAPRPMDYMPITVEPNGDVIVDTGDIRTRSDFDPSQAVPLTA